MHWCTVVLAGLCSAMIFRLVPFYYSCLLGEVFLWLSCLSRTNWTSFFTQDDLGFRHTFAPFVSPALVANRQKKSTTKSWKKLNLLNLFCSISTRFQRTHSGWPLSTQAAACFKLHERVATQWGVWCFPQKIVQNWAHERENWDFQALLMFLTCLKTNDCSCTFVILPFERYLQMWLEWRS